MKTNFDMVHSDKYADAIKIAQKFTSKNNVRLMLQLIYHRANGDMIATDSHHLIKIKGVHGFGQDYLVNQKSLEFAKGDYPEVDKLLEMESKVIIRLNQEQIKIWLQMHRSMNQMSKIKNIHTNITMNLNEKVSFELKAQNISFELPYEEFEGHESIERVTYNVEYMRDALEAHEKLKSNEVFIQMASELRPILLDNQEDVQAVVLPVRTY